MKDFQALREAFSPQIALQSKNVPASGIFWAFLGYHIESGSGIPDPWGGGNWIRIQSGSGHAAVEKTFLNFRVRGACWHARLLLLRARQRRAQGLSHQVQAPLTLFPRSCFSDSKIFGDKMCLGGGASALRFKVTATCNTSRARSVSYPPPPVLQGKSHEINHIF